MGLLLAFTPFIAFALVEKLFGVASGLASGALVSIALMLRGRLRGEHEINILEAGSALMFSALTAFTWMRGGMDWSVWRVRLFVDGGLLLIVLFSIAVRRPFTLQYARRQVSPEVARSAVFLRTNAIIASAWALAFAALVASDALMVLRPEATLWIAVGLTLGALAVAMWFTRWFAAPARAGAAATRSGQ